MGYFKLIFLFLLFPGIVHASFDSGGDMVFMEMGSTLITDTTSLKDVYLINVYGASLHGKLNLKNYTIYGKVNIIPNEDSNNLSIEKLYGAVDLNNFEITFGKQYFNTGYGRIFKINNLMGSIYSPLGIFELNGKTGISFMYYSSSNYFNIRGGMFLKQSSLPFGKFSDNTYAIEEEVNIEKYGFKIGQFYNFGDSGGKYLFSFSLNMDLFCGLNAEFQTFSNTLEKDSFSYKSSFSADYTLPFGNGIYLDVEYLYKKNRYDKTFSNIAIASFYDTGKNILAFQASYPFNLILKSSFFGLYNIDEKNYYIGSSLSMGKQIFHTDFILGYNKYAESMPLPYKGNLLAGLMFRLSL